MRSLLAAITTIGLSVTLLAACGKKEEPAPTANTAAPTPTTTAPPCSGMNTANDCTQCCNPAYWRPKFTASAPTGKRCECIKKLGAADHREARGRSL